MSDQEIRTGQRWRQKGKQWRAVEIIYKQHYVGDQTIWARTVEHRTRRIIGQEVAMDRSTLLTRWTLEADHPAAVTAPAPEREAPK
jgi:hypothetical protein